MKSDIFYNICTRIYVLRDFVFAFFESRLMPKKISVIMCIINIAIIIAIMGHILYFSFKSIITEFVARKPPTFRLWRVVR